MEQQEVEFVNGLFIKPPREGAPDFVKGSVSINRADLGNWLRGKQTDDGWINIDVKESKSGKWYCSVITGSLNRNNLHQQHRVMAHLMMMRYHFRS